MIKLFKNWTVKAGTKTWKDNSSYLTYMSNQQPGKTHITPILKWEIKIIIDTLTTSIAIPSCSSLRIILKLLLATTTTSAVVVVITTTSTLIIIVSLIVVLVAATTTIIIVTPLLLMVISTTASSLS